jgi:hypothetical protein
VERSNDEAPHCTAEFFTTSIKTHQWIFFWWSVFKLPVREKQTVKGKVVIPVHAMKTHSGSRDIAPPILKLGTSRR